MRFTSWTVLERCCDCGEFLSWIFMEAVCWIHGYADLFLSAAMRAGQFLSPHLTGRRSERYTTLRHRSWRRWNEIMVDVICKSSYWINELLACGDTCWTGSMLWIDTCRLVTDITDENTRCTYCYNCSNNIKLHPEPRVSQQPVKLKMTTGLFIPLNNVEEETDLGRQD